MLNITYNPLRNRLRNAEEAGELRALESLAEDPAIAAEAPSTLDSLAFTFRSLGERSRERSVLLIAQRAHPDDFWTNLRLGKVLIEDGRFDDSLRYLEAARALRPRSGYARFLLGSAYQGKRSRREVFLEFQNDIDIDPDPVKRCVSAHSLTVTARCACVFFGC